MGDGAGWPIGSYRRLEPSAAGILDGTDQRAAGQLTPTREDARWGPVSCGPEEAQVSGRAAVRSSPKRCTAVRRRDKARRS